MRTRTWEVVLGVFDDPTDGNRTFEAPEELDAINAVTGSRPDETFGDLVTAARKACPNTNCCLTSVITSGSEEIPEWTDDRDTSYDVSTLSARVQFRDDEGCAERAETLASGFAKVSLKCINATEEAKIAERKSSQPFVAQEIEIMDQARASAKELRIAGEEAAEVARKGVLSSAKKTIAYRRRRQEQGKS